MTHWSHALSLFILIRNGSGVHSLSLIELYHIFRDLSIDSMENFTYFYILTYNERKGRYKIGWRILECCEYAQSRGDSDSS